MVDISLGGTAGTMADPKVIFAAAIKGNKLIKDLKDSNRIGNANTAYASVAFDTLTSNYVIYRLAPVTR